MPFGHSLIKSLSPIVPCTVMYKITYFDHQGSWSFDIFTEKKYMCFLHKPIAVSLEFSSQITLNFKIIC